MMRRTQVEDEPVQGRPLKKRSRAAFRMHSSTGSRDRTEWRPFVTLGATIGIEASSLPSLVLNSCWSQF